MKRRDFLNLSMITAASAALAGCGRPAEPAFMSQAQMPEFYLPGIAQWYATTCTECSAGCGLGVRVIGGRAKKVEGIETHPLSKGGHCLRAETSLQSLYNPDRLRQPWKGDAPQQSWDEAIKAVSASFGQPGLWITGPLTGTVGAMIAAAAAKSKSKIWVLDFPGTTAERAAMKSLGEQARLPYYDISDADYVVNFGSDFLSSSHPNNVEYNWQYGQFRNGKGRTRRGILVSFCSRMNLSVSVSDKWVPVKPGTEGLIAAAVAGMLGGGHGGAVTAEAAAKEAGIDAELIHKLAERLKAAKKAVAIGGFENTAYSNGAAAMAAIAALNKALPGNKVATFEPDVLVFPNGVEAVPTADLLITTKQALEGLKAGQFANIWVNDVNPAYLFPQKSLDVAGALKKANTIAFTPFVTETSVCAKWTLPTTSMLEQWGDAMVEGPNPVYGIQQPVVLPIPGSKPMGQILLEALSGVLTFAADEKTKKAPATVRDLMAPHFGSEPDWIRSLERGGLYKDFPRDWSPYPAQVMFPPALEPAVNVKPTAKTAGLWDGMKAASVGAVAPPKFSGKGTFALIPYPSPVLGDGSITNRPWAAEIPDPMAQAVWTTWVEVNPETCKKLELKRMDLVEITADNGEKVVLPVLPSPSVHPEAVAIPMGMGHTSFGRYAFGKGYNPMNLVTPTFQDGTDEMAWAGTTVSIRKTGQNGFGTPGQTGWVTTYDWRAGDMERALYED